MKRRPVLALGALAALSGCVTPGGGSKSTIASAGIAGDANALQRALAATGAATLNTLSYSATGTGSVFGQAWLPDGPWPRVTYGVFSRALDYVNAAMREDFARARAEPNGGGALPLMGQGEQRATAMLRGDWAWNMVGPAPQPAPVALDARVHDLWTTPHGILKAAQRYGARISPATVAGRPGHTLAVAVPGRFTAVAHVDADGLVERVESRQPHPVLGDLALTTVYADWRAQGAIKFPMRIVQLHGNVEVFNLTVQSAQANAPVDVQAPALVSSFAERVASEKLAEGLWYLAGGSHHSVLVEMRDHLLLVEAPLYDGRTQAVLAEARRLAPGKPVRYVVNSHHHFDHAGGLRAAAAEGATLVTSAMAKPYFERVLANPNSIRPDALQRSGRRASIVGVAGQQVFTDGRRQVVVHEMQGSVHAQGFLMVWLPAEKVLVQADAFTPTAPGTPRSGVANANHLNLLFNLQRLEIRPARLAPLHGRVVDYEELINATRDTASM